MSPAKSSKNSKNKKVEPIKKAKARKLIDSIEDPVERRINELHRIHGKVTPEIIIEDAKDENSPLHKEFNWNVEEAAYQHWIDTARRLIRSVTLVITVESHKVVVPRYVHSPQEENAQAYHDVAVIKSNRDRSQELMAHEIARVYGLLKRVNNLSKVLEVNVKPEIDKIDRQLKEIKRKVS